jgi:hypothetical protein
MRVKEVPKREKKCTCAWHPMSWKRWCLSPRYQRENWCSRYRPCTNWPNNNRIPHLQKTVWIMVFFPNFSSFFAIPGLYLPSCFSSWAFSFRIGWVQTCCFCFWNSSFTTNPSSANHDWRRGYNLNVEVAGISINTFPWFPRTYQVDRFSIHRNCSVLEIQLWKWIKVSKKAHFLFFVSLY